MGPSALDFAACDCCSRMHPSLADSSLIGCSPGVILPRLTALEMEHSKSAVVGRQCEPEASQDPSSAVLPAASHWRLL